MKKTRWLSARDLTFTANGKHELDFDPAFPLRLEYYDFILTEKLTPSYHDFLELNFIVSGTGRYHVADKKYQVSGGDLIVINRTEFHLLENISRRPLKSICIYFMPELFYHPGDSLVNYECVAAFYTPREHFRSRISLPAPRRRRVWQLVRRMEGEIKGQKPYYRVAVRNCLAEILLQINRSASRVPPAPERYDEQQRRVKRLQAVFAYIKDHYPEKLTNRQLGEVAYMSPSYLCRFFRNVTGLTLTDYIVRYRIDRAKERLLNSSLTINQIAFDVGFESHSYFDRVFRQLTRSTPKQFRQ